MFSNNYEPPIIQNIVDSEIYYSNLLNPNYTKAQTRSLNHSLTEKIECWKKRFCGAQICSHGCMAINKTLFVGFDAQATPGTTFVIGAKIFSCFCFKTISETPLIRLNARDIEIGRFRSQTTGSVTNLINFHSAPMFYFFELGLHFFTI